MSLTDVFRRSLCSAADAEAVVGGGADHPDIMGRVLFYQVGEGVLILADVSGLPNAEQCCKSPVFGFHIHGGGSCSGSAEDPFGNTMGHYDSEGCAHPYHAGDMPPLFGANGNAFLAFYTDRFRLSEVIGRTVVIHSGRDDFTSQPAGNAGEKIACGVIRENRAGWRRYRARRCSKNISRR